MFINSPLLDPIQSQMNAVQIHMPYSFNIYFNIVILPYTLSPKWSEPVTFPDKSSMYFFICHMCATYATHLNPLI